MDLPVKKKIFASVLSYLHLFNGTVTTEVKMVKEIATHMTKKLHTLKRIVASNLPSAVRCARSPDRDDH